MTPATARLAVPALLALLVAAALALLADAVLAVGRDLGGGNAAARPAGLRFRVADSVLGVGDDRRLREALRLFEESRLPGTTAREALEQHADLEAKLTRIVSSGDEPARRALAANLDGILLFEDAGLDPASAARYLELSLRSFRQSVTLDPGNVDAKLNLELVGRFIQKRRGELGGDSGSSGDSGAGASEGGSGY